MRRFFTALSTKASQMVGSFWAFLLAVLTVLVWGVTGPMFDFSDTWQLVINTGTTIITFLMVFLIQNTQNRDAKAMHLKLDELIIAVRRAHNEMIDIEELDDEHLEKIAEVYRRKKERFLTGDSGKAIKDEIQEVAYAAAERIAEDTAKGTAEKVARDTAKGESAKKVALVAGRAKDRKGRGPGV